MTIPILNIDTKEVSELFIDSTEVYELYIDGKLAFTKAAQSSPFTITNVGSSNTAVQILMSSTTEAPLMQLSLEYSLNDGSTWQNMPIDQGVMIPAGSSMMIRAVDTNEAFYKTMNGQITKYRFIIAASNVELSGNVMSLLAKDFVSMDDLSEMPNAFRETFYGCSTIVDASELELPAKTLSDGCYKEMFNGCTSMTDSPRLPAEQLADNCYDNLFYGCTSLSSVSADFKAWNTGSTDSWMTNVSSTGTFYCDTLLPEVRGISNIPNNWEIVRGDE